MKPAFLSPTAFNASVILPLLPVFLLGAAILTGGKEAMTTEITRRDQTAKLAAVTAAPKGLPYGPYTVIRVPDILLSDRARSKDVPVTVTAPDLDAAGPFPVILFSHGVGSDGTQNESLLRWWASHGYVVISPTHSDSLRWQQRRQDLCDRSGSGIEEGDIGLQGIIRLATHDPQAGAQRARDVSFVLDSLCDLEKRVPALEGRIDHARIGAAGTALGAYTAELISGATVSVPGTSGAISFRDPRARAVLQLSGMGSGQQGLTKSSWNTVRLPIMTMTGSEDRGPGEMGPEGKRESFDLSPATGNKYHVFITGAHRGSFGGRFAGHRRRQQPATTNQQTDQKAIFCYIEQTSLAFWDMTLKNDAAAKTLLDQNPGALSRQRGVTATVEHK